MELIENRIQQSGIITFDIDEYLDDQPIIQLNLESWLHQGLIVKEKEFRFRLKEHDWSQYAGKSLLVEYPEDALIPSWAFMLIVVSAKPFTDIISFGKILDIQIERINMALDKIDFSRFQGKKVVIKGCSSIEVKSYYYTKITKVLFPYAQSIMYGEPCSAVPVFKRRLV